MSKSILDRVSIGSSCQTDWEAMNGDQSQRYCDQCEKSVYNFSQLTRSQAEALIARTNGKLCARIERRPDGSILTADKSYSLPRFNQKILRIASATMSAALSLAPVVAAKPIKNLPVLNFSQEQKDKTDPKDKEKTAKIYGTVSDETQAVIPNAKIVLVNFATKHELFTSASSEGTYAFSSIEPGLYNMIVTYPGFHQFIENGIAIQAEKSQKRNVEMKLGNFALMGDIVMIEPAPKRFVRRVTHVLERPFKKIIGLTRKS
jgi:hypothetical protein